MATELPKKLFLKCLRNPVDIFMERRSFTNIPSIRVETWNRQLFQIFPA